METRIPPPCTVSTVYWGHSDADGQPLPTQDEPELGAADTCAIPNYMASDIRNRDFSSRGINPVPEKEVN